VESEHLPRSVYLLYGKLMAVISGARPVGVVDELRAVERGRNQNVMRAKIFQDLVGHQGEVRRHHELDALSRLISPLFRIFDDAPDELEVQQRLSTLELYLEVFG